MRTPRALTLTLGLALVISLAGCGRKGALLPPLSKEPSPPSDVALTQRGGTILITWQNPTTFIDGFALGGLSAVEVWLCQDTLEAGKPAPRPPTAEQFASNAKLLRRITSEEFPGTLKKEKESQDKADTQQVQNKPGRAAKKARPKQKTAAELTLRYEYVLTSEKPDTTRLFFGLRAADDKGRLSDYSGPNALIPRVLPSAPADLQGVVKNDAVDLRWQAPVDNFDKSKPPQVKGYNVYRSLQGGPPVRLNTELISATETTDPTFEFGKETVYTVRAATRDKEPFGESGDSAPFRVRPEDVFPPSAPAGLTAVAGPDFISLTWDANVEKDLAGYRVWRRVQGQTEYEELTAAPVKETTFQDNTAAQGRRYEYAVTAEDLGGNRSAFSKPASEHLKGGGA